MIALARLGYIIAVRRIISAWWLELVLFAGILLAVSLLASGVIFSDMLAEAGATWVITGHSERREARGETNADIAAKSEAAHKAGINVILCVGETLAVRDAGRAEQVVADQLLASLPEGAAADWLGVAYEPIWAIGTGRTATSEDIAAMHAAIRALLNETYGEEASSLVRILYGGSVKPDNARDILATPEVGGALVGGASLSAESFLGIVVGASEAEDA